MNRITHAGWTVLAIVGVCLVWLGLSGCPGAGWRALDATQKARAITAKQLATAVKTKHAACLKTHGAQTAEYAECIKTHRDALRTWRRVVRPAVNSSVAITAAALQIYDKAGGDKPDWIALIKPAVCALSRGVKSWSVWFGDKGAAALSALKMIEGVTCHE